jgi:histidyl-tRNA synthetase
MDLGRRSLKGQLGAARGLGARYLAIIGGDGALATLKDMQAGGQREIATDAVVHAVLRGHHEL